MGQNDVLPIFKKNPKKWFTSYDLLSLLPGHQRSQITQALNKLRKHGMLYRKIRFEHILNAKNGSRYYVRYFKLVPKDRYVSFSHFNNDTLNKTGNKGY